MASILTTIEAAMKTLIDGMTVVGGYNFDWGDSNQPDEALVDANDVFPMALILIENETNTDLTGGVWASAYQNEVTFKIIVKDKLDAVQSVPNFAINDIHNKCLDDLKKLFGVNYNIGNTCGVIMYVGSERIIDEENGDVFRPGHLETEWLVRYAQDRTDPTQNA